MYHDDMLQLIRGNQYESCVNDITKQVCLKALLNCGLLRLTNTVGAFPGGMPNQRERGRKKERKKMEVWGDDANVVISCYPFQENSTNSRT